MEDQSKRAHGSRWPRWILITAGALAAVVVAAAYTRWRQAAADMSRLTHDMSAGRYGRAQADMTAAKGAWPWVNTAPDAHLLADLRLARREFSAGESAWQAGDWATARADLARVRNPSPHYAAARHQLALLKQAQQDGAKVGAVLAAYSAVSGDLGTFSNAYNSVSTLTNTASSDAQNVGNDFANVSGTTLTTFQTALASAQTAWASLSGASSALGSSVARLSTAFGALPPLHSPTLSVASMAHDASSLAVQTNAQVSDFQTELADLTAMQSGYVGGFGAAVLSNNSATVTAQNDFVSLQQSMSVLEGVATQNLRTMLNTSGSVSLFVTGS